MNSYTGFAEIYDTLMDDFDYAAWSEYYLKLIEPVDAKRICDCACGTGSLTIEYAAKIAEVIGSDISGEMLRVAGEKARRKGVSVRWLCADMCRLELPKPVDAVLCGCDGVNYLTSMKRVKAFFTAAFNCIRSGGMLAFDISSEYKLREVMGDAFFGEERDEMAYLWQNSMEGDIITMDLTFFVEEGNGLYRKFNETHRQRAHSVPEIVAALEETGFTDIHVYGDRTFKAPENDELRIHFTALKQ